MNRWQQLGAWVNSGYNLSDWHLDQFAACGGRWIVPVTINDSSAGPWNMEHFEETKAKCAKRGIRLGSWHNYFGEDPVKFAGKVAAFVNEHNAGPVFIDAEFSVQGNTLLSSVMLECRKVMPTRFLAITTNSLNDSVVYNGRIEGVPMSLWKSAYDLGFRIAPQWYNSPPYGQRSNPWTTADLNMKWLKEFGDEDNLRDSNHPATYYSVPLSYVHPVIEVTGLEGADLDGEIKDLYAARPYGFTVGFSIYLLENTQESDFKLLAAERGKLFLA